MVGYVTDTRTYRDLSLMSERKLSGSPIIYDGYSYVGIPYQTTTSWRTGIRSGITEDDPLFSGGTSLSTLAKVRTRDFHRTDRYDNGHEFATLRNTFRCSHPNFYGSNANKSRWYRGPLLINKVSTTMKYPTLGSGNFSYYGPKLIASATPGNSPADLATALIELYREGLPRLFGASTLQNQTNLARAAGEEYLNKEFGWDPLVQDVKDLATAVARSSQILSQYQEGAGTVIRVRRSQEGPSTTSVAYSIPNGTLYPYISTIGVLDPANNTAPLTVTIESDEVYSFSGAFTYYLQGAGIVNGLHSFVEKANYLYGLELTPEVLWNVAPWTWLADWMGNLGVNITNATNLASDGTVMRYGYVMRKARTTVTAVLGNTTFLSGARTGTVINQWITESKERKRASPYGFGLNPAVFNDRQWTILGALGLTRGNRSIRLSEPA